MTTSSPTPEDSTAKASKPWYKKIWVWIVIVIVLVVIGTAIGGEDSETTAEQEDTSSVEESTQRWQRTDDYESFCTGEPSIDQDLQPVVDAVEIPDNGHVQFTRLASDTDDPAMSTVFFALCSPAEGDDLRAIAEDLAIQVRQSPLGETVSEMGVNASYANPDGSENILRDDSFQMNLHDGGEARENGAYRAAWEVRN